MTPDSRIAEIERERQTGMGVSPTNVVWLLSQLKASLERIETLEKALRDLIDAEQQFVADTDIRLNEGNPS